MLIAVAMRLESGNHQSVARNVPPMVPPEKFRREYDNRNAAPVARLPYWLHSIHPPFERDKALRFIVPDYLTHEAIPMDEP